MFFFNSATVQFVTRLGIYVSGDFFILFPNDLVRQVISSPWSKAETLLMLLYLTMYYRAAGGGGGAVSCEFGSI